MDPGSLVARADRRRCPVSERANAWLAASLRHRLWFSEVDTYETASLPFGLCRRGDRALARHVSCGVFDGREVRCFDLDLLEDVRPGVSPGPHRLIAGMVLEVFEDETGGANVTLERWECAVVRAGAECRRVSVAPEGLLTTLADLALVPDQDVELEAFNRAFEVRADDRRFASALLDARMVEFLVAEALGCVVEAVGNRILVARPAGARPDLDALLSLVVGVAERVPNVVRTMQPPVAIAPLTPRCPMGPDGVVQVEPAGADVRFDPWPDVPGGWV